MQRQDSSLPPQSKQVTSVRGSQGPREAVLAAGWEGRGQLSEERTLLGQESSMSRHLLVGGRGVFGSAGAGGRQGRKLRLEQRESQGLSGKGVSTSFVKSQGTSVGEPESKGLSNVNQAFSERPKPQQHQVVSQRLLLGNCRCVWAGAEDRGAGTAREICENEANKVTDEGKQQSVPQAPSQLSGPPAHTVVLMFLAALAPSWVPPLESRKHHPVCGPCDWHAEPGMASAAAGISGGLMPQRIAC